MTLSRRDFASLFAGALGGLALPGRLRATHAAPLAAPLRRPSPRETFFQWIPVSDRARVAMGGGGNTLLYLGEEGALQSDAKNFGLGRTLRREAESQGRRVTHFVNTHHHGDHSGGNEGFPDALRFAHANAEPRILESAAASLERAGERLPELVARLREEGAPAEMLRELEEMTAELDSLTPGDFGPDRTFRDDHRLSLGGPPVLLRWVSRGHTDGDVFVHLPEENVLHCGDLFFHGRHPYVDDSAGATPMGWIRCVDAMLELCDGETVVVPGHGEITDRTGLAGQRDYFLRLQQTVEEALAAGMGRDEVTALAPDELAGLPGAERHLPRNLGIVYDEMTA